jgi:hypothetical protein
MRIFINPKIGIITSLIKVIAIMLFNLILDSLVSYPAKAIPKLIKAIIGVGLLSL